MKENKISLFYRVFRILLSISIVGAGLSLIYGCLWIYRSGAYSYESVSTAFSMICIPVYVCLGLVALSIVLELILPYTDKAKAQISYEDRLKLMLSKKDLSECGDEKLLQIKSERKKRKLINALKWVLVALSSLAFLVYALNGSNFDTKEINASVISAMWVMLPCLAVMFVASLVAEILSGKSFQREAKLISDLPSKAKADASAEIAKCKGDRKLVIIRCVILLIAVGLLIFGFATGGFADVLTKAVNICTECIGLG